MSGKSHFLLGLFFVIVLAVLGYYTLFLTDVTPPWSERTELTVRFSQANGLRKGDAVLVAGVRWGRIQEIRYDPTAPHDRRITVVASLDQTVELREGAEILIEDATLLGGKNLTIDPGPPDGAPMSTEGDLYGAIAPNAMEAIGRLARDNSGALNEAIDGIRNIVKGVEEGRGGAGRFFSDEQFAQDLSRGMASIADSAENVERITGNLAEGRGTLGRLMAEDDPTYDKLQRIADDLGAFLADARATMADIREGQGAVGLLLSDEQTREQVRAFIENATTVSQQIASGEGTLGRLVMDGGIADSLEKLFSNAENGTIGKLFADDGLYQNLLAMTDDGKEVFATIREGRGSIGKLVMEDEMYNELFKAVALMTRSLEEYREAAPISTMTSVIFAAF